MLNESEAKYRALVEASSQIICTLDRDAKVTDDSWHSWRNFTGQTELDWRSGDSIECVHPEDQDRIGVLWNSIPSNDVPTEYEYRLRHMSGDWRWVSERIVPLRAQNGQVDGWIRMTEDITRAKQTRLDITESESRYRALVQATSQIVWRADSTGKIRRDSPTWRAFTGRPIEEYMDDRWNESIHPDDLSEAVRSWDQAVETRAWRLVEYRLRRSDGQWRWMMERSVPYEAGWVSMAVDVTDAKAAEKRLADRERHLSLALKASHMAAWHLELSSGTLVVEGGDLLPELANSESHLEALFAAMTPSAVFQLTRLIHASRHQMAPIDFEFELLGRNQPMWLSMHGRHVPSTQSDSSRVFGVICDITGRKLIDERRNLLVGEIAHRGKNLLAVVQAIASITITGEGDPLEASGKFQERLATLGRSHSLLTEKDWYGVPLDEIVKLEFGKFADRASIDIVAVTLNPSAAQNCALVFHELITNTVKYGALSLKSGRVTVRGYRVKLNDEDCIQIEWIEEGGPAVTQPKRQGFGSILLHRLVSGFGTEGRLDYLPGGFRMEVAMPLAMIQPTEAAVTRRTAY